MCGALLFFFFFFNDPPPTEISPLSLHAALPIPRVPSRREDRRPALDVSLRHLHVHGEPRGRARHKRPLRTLFGAPARRLPTHGPPLGRAERSEEHTSELQSLAYLVCRLLLEKKK